MTFVESGSHMSFDLFDPAIEHAGRRRPIPNPGSFDRNPPEGNVKVIQIDAGCGGQCVVKNLYSVLGGLLVNSLAH